MMKQPDHNRKTFSVFHRVLAFTLACVITIALGSVVYAGYEQANKTKELANTISAQATLQSVDSTQDPKNYPTLTSTVTNNGDGTATIILDISDIQDQNSDTASAESSLNNTEPTQTPENSSAVESQIPNSSSSDSSAPASSESTSASNGSESSSSISNSEASSSTSTSVASSEVSSAPESSSTSATSNTSSDSTTSSSTSASASDSASTSASASEELDDSSLPSDEELGINPLADTASNPIRIYSYPANINNDNTDALTKEQLASYEYYEDGDEIAYINWSTNVYKNLKAFDPVTGEFIPGLYFLQEYNTFNKNNITIFWNRAPDGIHTTNLLSNTITSYFSKFKNGTNKISLYFAPYVSNTDSTPNFDRMIKLNFLYQEMYLLDLNFCISPTANDLNDFTSAFSDVTFSVTKGTAYFNSESDTSTSDSILSILSNGSAASISNLLTNSNGRLTAYVEKNTQIKFTITLANNYMISTFLHNGHVYRNSVYDANNSTDWSTFRSTTDISKPQVMEIQFAKDADQNGIPDHVDPMQDKLFGGI